MLQITWQHKQSMKVGTVSRWPSEIRNGKALPVPSLYSQCYIISEGHSQLSQKAKNPLAAVQGQLTENDQYFSEIIINISMYPFSDSKQNTEVSLSL